MADAGDWRTEIKRVWIFADGSPSFDFDGVLSEGHSSKLAIMENPVETGVLVADHVFSLPKELEINGVVSDIWLLMREANGQTVGPLNADKPWLVPADSGDSSRRSARAYQLLLGLQASGTPFSVQTGLRLYQNMLITELSANQDKRTAGALAFRATLREVQIVSTRTVTYPPRATGSPTRAASKKTTSGEKQAVEAPPEKKVSLALQAARTARAVQ